MNWEILGTDESGMPTHLPMGVNKHGQGPENDSSADHFECWCKQPECPLTMALRLAGTTGSRKGWQECVNWMAYNGQASVKGWVLEAAEQANPYEEET